MGGLDALKRLVNRLSADFPAAVFLVVYVAANSPSLLALHMGRDAQNCRLQVEDEGVGFATDAVSAHSESNGTGLFNTRERLALFDGDIDIQSRPRRVHECSLPHPLMPSLSPTPPVESKLVYEQQAKGSWLARHRSPHPNC